MVETADLTEAWNELKTQIQIGQIVEGTVMAHWHFGIFVNIGSPFVALIEIPNFKDNHERMTPQEYPELGEFVRGVVVGFRDRNHQVELTARPSALAKASA